MKVWLGLVLILGLSASGWGQSMPTAVAGQSYDIVTIKLNPAGPGSTRVSIDDTYYRGTNVSLADMMTWAYGVRSGLLQGLPKWADSTRYDVSAKVSEPDVRALKEFKTEARRAMLRAVLEDRFQLKVHRETKTLTVLNLEVDKGGPKFKVNPAPAEGQGASPGGRGNMNTRNGEMTATAIPMKNLVEFLERELDQTVIDKTELTAEYDLHMTFLREGRPEVADSPPRLATALPEQLGLKLSGAKGPVEVVVIDKVGMPGAN